jgi:hypothetical protein
LAALSRWQTLPVLTRTVHPGGGNVGFSNDTSLLIADVPVARVGRANSLATECSPNVSVTWTRAEVKSDAIFLTSTP